VISYCFVIKLQCETLIEEHVELLIEAFQDAEGLVENNLCVDIIG